MNRDIENAVLSSILFDYNILDTLLEHNLIPDDFQDVYNKEIYKQMLEFHKDDLPFDEIYLVDKLNKKYEPILINILSTNPITNPAHYIESMKDSRLKNELLRLSSVIRDRSDDLNGKELLGIYQNTIDELDKKSLFDGFLELHNINDIKAKKVQIICAKYLPFPSNSVSLIAAPGDTGKTFLAINIALHYILENHQKNKKVFAWFGEDPEEIIKDRYDEIAKTLYKKDEQRIILDKKYKQNFVTTDEITFGVLEQIGSRYKVNEFFYIMKQKLKDYSLIILDPLIGFYCGDENDNAYARMFMQLFLNWAKNENKTIIFLHHTPKKSKDSRGAGAIRDAARLLYLIDKIRDKDDKVIEKSNNLKITLNKDNYNIKSVLSQKQFKIPVFPPRNSDEVKIG